MFNLIRGTRPYVAPAPALAEGEADPRYPRNNRNQPEFGSVILTFDHTSQRENSIHIIQKCVYGTETAAEALLSLMHDYYPSLGAPALAINDMATFEILKQLDSDPENMIALFFVPVVVDRMGGNFVQVILSMIALQRLIAHPAYGNGSALLGMDALAGAIQAIAQATVKQQGELPPLLLLELQDKAVDRAAEQRVSA
jgi:hypothetical protein